ncbi:hypothetical protein D3C80_1027400 [compost metagenome]
MQQPGQVDNQQQAIERSLASIAQQPAQQMAPQLALGAFRYRGLTVRRACQRALTDEGAGWVDDHCIIADPPPHRVSKRFSLPAACLGLVDTRQGKTLIGAIDEAALAGMLITQYQIPRQPIQSPSTACIVQIPCKALVQRLLLGVDEGQRRVRLGSHCQSLLSLQTAKARTQYDQPAHQGHQHEHQARQTAMGHARQWLLFTPCPVRAKPPDGNQHQRSANSQQQRQCQANARSHRQAPAFELLP